jgi:hypothetical protein
MTNPLQVVGQMRDRYSHSEPLTLLEAWVRGAFPSAGRVVHRWSSVVFRPAGRCRGQCICNACFQLCVMYVS